MEEKTITELVEQSNKRAYEFKEAMARKTKPREETISEAKDALAMTERLLSTDPDDLLNLLVAAPNESIAEVFISAYGSVCRSRLEKALSMRKEASDE